MRFQLFEFEDFEWFPSPIRDGGTDYLRYFLVASELYKPCISLIRDTLMAVGENEIIDLCSGGGGYIENVSSALNDNESNKISITLTDRFPNLDSCRSIKAKSNGLINYREDSVDILNIPKDLKGVRTLFSAIHHFKPDDVRTILQETVASKSSICIFDGGENKLIAIIGMLVIHPLAFVLFTPFFQTS